MEIQEFTNSVETLRDGLLKQAMHYLGNVSDAEDAVQETLLKLWVVKERVADATKMRHLASVVCRNVSLNMLRGVRQTFPIETAVHTANTDNPQKQLESQENSHILRRSVLALSDKYRAIIRMRNVENMSYAEIAKVIGATESSVRGMMSKARKELLLNINRGRR